VIGEKRLVARFPCNLRGFFASCTLPLRIPEPPRKASNLSPKPSPKRAVIGAHDGDWQRSAEAKAGRSSFFSDGLRIEESRLALRADGVDEAGHAVVCGSDGTRTRDLRRDRPVLPLLL
jgi:hypothetical protein